MAQGDEPTHHKFGQLRWALSPGVQEPPSPTTENSRIGEGNQVLPDHLPSPSPYVSFAL